MYACNTIVNHNEEILLPKCMYSLRKIIDHGAADENVTKTMPLEVDYPNQSYLKELEERQNQLLKKCDVLIERLNILSSIPANNTCDGYKIEVPTPTEDIVLVLDPENIPFYIEFFMNKEAINLSWHIHSSVSRDKEAKIKVFISKLNNLNNASNFKIKLIFKSGDAELRTSSLSMPIIGNINILRYLAIVTPCVTYYHEDHHFEHILDLCHILERTTEKDKSLNMLNEIFIYKKNNISGDMFTILDLALYSIIKQRYNTFKNIQSEWFNNCKKYFE